MAHLIPEDDIFSPVRFDTSLAGSSINSGGFSSMSSASYVDFKLSFNDSPKPKFSPDCLAEESENQKDIEGLNILEDKESKNSLVPTRSPKKSLINLDEGKTSLSINKEQNVERRNTSTNANSSKEELQSIEPKTKTKSQKVGLDVGSYEIKFKKTERPTTLLPLKHGSNKNSKDSSKLNTNESLLLNDKDQHTINKTSNSISNGSFLNASKVANTQNHQKGSSKLSDEQGVTLTDQLSDSKETDEKMAKLIRDQISLEFSGIRDQISSEIGTLRQNLYTQQMMFYRELNRVKEQMQKQHLENVSRFYETIEELAYMNYVLKENA